ncbi:MAG TPA: hypothetical protein VF765_02100 [Polyangiaceae bacterium]
MKRLDLVRLLGATALVTIPSIARAQSDAAIAEQLFRDGRALLEAGKTDQACEKFAASQRIAPALGTTLNLALCREKQGKTATAWSLYMDAEQTATRAGDAARARFAQDHVAALAPQLKKVVIEVPTPPPGMVVTLDGTQLPGGALGTEIPLDPGEHDLVVAAPGKKKWEQSHLALGPSATTVHVRVELEDDTAAAPAQAAAPSPPPPSMAASTTPPEDTPGGAPPGPEHPASSTDPKLVAGIAAGGVGVIALGVATYYWVTAISRNNDQNDYPVGSQERLTVYNQAKTAQTWGFVFGGIGVAGLGAGAVLVIMSLHDHSTQPATAGSWHVVPALGPGVGGALLQRTF